MRNNRTDAESRIGYRIVGRTEVVGRRLVAVAVAVAADTAGCNRLNFETAHYQKLLMWQELAHLRRKIDDSWLLGS